LRFSDFISRFDTFLQFYENNERRAGIFNYINGNWNFQLR